MDTFEQSVRAILGQRFTLPGVLPGKLAQVFGEPLVNFPDWRLFPTPERLASLSPGQLKPLGMPLKRGAAIIHLAQQMVKGEFPLHTPVDVEQGVKMLISYPGWSLDGKLHCFAWLAGK